MCGIFSYLSKKELTSAEYEELRKYGNKCQYRGPDNTIEVIINNIFLLFHRLIINDTSELGNQPMVHPTDKNIILMCNGEIYNCKKLIN